VVGNNLKEKSHISALLQTPPSKKRKFGHGGRKGKAEKGEGREETEKGTGGEKNERTSVWGLKIRKTLTDRGV